MMSQFWIYTLADGRRVLVLAGARPDRYDFAVGFGAVVRILPAA